MTETDQASANQPQPLWKAERTRCKIVVISDLHLGVNDRFAETVKNRPILVDFLQRLRVTTDVRELVINGDFLDDWFLPLTQPAHSDAYAFYQEVVRNNAVVITALQRIAWSGIKLVYVPGNHDMTLVFGLLTDEIPELVEARDAEGLGAHRCGDRDEILIEHGHRFDPFSAPDPVTNADLCPPDEKTMLPAGYFYARFGASWVAQGFPPIKKDYPRITEVPDPADEDQYGAYAYYQVLNLEMHRLTPIERFEDKVVDLDYDGLHGSYSLQDFYPVLQDGRISAPTLFREIQTTWRERERINRVDYPIPFAEAAAGALDINYFAKQAGRQYLNDRSGQTEIVVFGHTHVPDFREFPLGKVYLNEGTWIDHNPAAPSERTFAVITTGSLSQAVVMAYGADGSLTDITASITKEPPA
jgi:UDP-2,3-diacylglucosamine pyrophosphatase LpxH